MSRVQQTLKLVSTRAVALGAGAACALLAGCGGTKAVTATETMTNTTTVSLTDTTTDTATVTHTRKISSLPPVTTTRTQTVTVTTPPPSEHSFSGNGGENLGTIHVSSDSIIHWTNDGAVFQILDTEDSVEVNSQGHSGQSVISAGTYHHFEVNAEGNWTIQIAAQ